MDIIIALSLALYRAFTSAVGTDPIILLIVGAGIGFLLNIPSSLIAASLWESITNAVPSANIFGSTKIDGFWIGKVTGNPAIGGGTGINLYRIILKKGVLHVYIEHYKEHIGECVRIQGIGLFNPPHVAIAYEFDKLKRVQSGAFVGRIYDGANHHQILGAFSQYIDFYNGIHRTPKFFSEEYTLTKVQLPLRRRLRFLARKKYYDCYSDVMQQSYLSSVL